MKERLIKANKLRKDFLDLPNCYNGFSDTYDKSLIIEVVDEQPTVEAIPIEWVEKKAKMYDDLAAHIGGMWGEIYSDWAHLLRQLVEKWREENGTDRQEQTP